MGLNSPIPVRLPEECRKAAKILRSFVDSSNNGLDKVIPRSVLEKAVGFAIFTVFKAGFVFSARAGSGVVIARLDDGSWSAPSAIGLGGFGVGGQMGAEVTDFLIVLNSRAAVASFMSAGSLTIGGNLSVAVGPLGRNAEGSGAVNSKGKVAAMYSYSKTKGLFGGVSVEGSLIVERQDANRLAYGGNPSSKQILSGVIDPPEWADQLVEQLEKCTGLPGGQKWRNEDEDREGGGMGGRDRSGSTGYAFGGGIGAGGRDSPNLGGSYTGSSNGSKNDPNRKRSGSLLSNVLNSDKVGLPSRPSSGSRRSSSFLGFNSGSASPKRAVLPSSESYNAGLTWDSSGPIQQYGNRSRSGSSALRPTTEYPEEKSRSAFGGKEEEAGAELEGEDDLLGDWEPSTQLVGGHNKLRKKQNNDDPDLLGTWDSDGDALSASFARMSTSGSRNRSDSKPARPNDDFLDLGEDHLPKEWDSSNNAGLNGQRGAFHREAGPFSSYAAPASRSAPGVSSPFEDPAHIKKVPSSRPFDDYFPTQRTAPPSAPPIPAKPNSTPSLADRYPKAVALFDFRPTDPGDLGLVTGEMIRCLDGVGKGDWWRGMDAHGKTGIFPCSYVEVLEIPRDYKGGLTRSQLKTRLGGAEFE